MVDEDRLLPIANVGRIMKQALPPTAKVAKQVLQECATEFVSFVTCEASDKCRKENRKTMTGEDLCWALRNLGFEDYADAMLGYMHKLRQNEREKEKGRQQQQNKDESSVAQADLENTNFAPLEFRIIEKNSNS